MSSAHLHLLRGKMLVQVLEHNFAFCLFLKKKLKNKSLCGMFTLLLPSYLQEACVSIGACLSTFQAIQNFHYDPGFNVLVCSAFIFSQPMGLGNCVFFPNTKPLFSPAIETMFFVNRVFLNGFSLSSVFSVFVVGTKLRSFCLQHVCLLIVINMGFRLYTLRNLSCYRFVR